jgi:hypothetical protein
MRMNLLSLNRNQELNQRLRVLADAKRRDAAPHGHARADKKRSFKLALGDSAGCQLGEA